MTGIATPPPEENGVGGLQVVDSSPGGPLRSECGNGEANAVNWSLNLNSILNDSLVNTGSHRTPQSRIRS